MGEDKIFEEQSAHGLSMDKSLLYLVRETKDTTHLDELRPDERRRILCGANHFQEALGVDYKVVTSAEEL